ncbi:MAG: hypothetical protein KJ906_00325 [Nanoarchaeota archaeon]|nr:hypothetical protein [Nanoarchaeota archaeon]
MAFNVFTLIFETLLKIDPSIIAKYTTVPDQLLYLILIPHVILLMFIYAVSKGTVLRIVGEHKGFSYLFQIITYIFIVWGGWYGSILIPLLTGWFTIVLVLAFIVFFISVIWHPAAGKVTSGLISKGFESVGKKANKGKEIDALEDQLTYTRKTLKRLDDDMRAAKIANDRRTMATLKALYSQKLDEEQQLKRAIEELGG